MALESVMRVNKGKVIGGGSGGGASKNFQGTIEEWNALTTEQKKAYDHASIPDSLDGNVTFPASKVMMLDGDSVEDRVDAHIIDGVFIDISSYIYNSGIYNDYTAPSDGYVVFKYSASADGGMLIKTSANTHITMATTKELIQSIFMKKGMQFCFGSTPSTGRFYPIA